MADNLSAASPAAAKPVKQRKGHRQVVTGLNCDFDFILLLVTSTSTSPHPDASASPVLSRPIHACRRPLTRCSLLVSPVRSLCPYVVAQFPA